MSHLIPCGAQTYSKSRSRYPANAPRYADSVDGAYVVADGRRYIDYVSALGAVILGHRYPPVEEAVRRQLERGVSFSLPTRLEGELAERLLALAGSRFEMVRYQKNGQDVTAAAVRLARAVTGRTTVLMFEGGYHGANDVFIEPPMDRGVASPWTRRIKAFDLAALEWALSRYRPACLIFEAVRNTNPTLPPDGYFAGARKLCDREGTLLILDEMVTGFRLGLPGALTMYGIEPDLVCYGKAMANGYPLAALLGPRDIMRRIETDVFVSSTFGGEALSLAAALATLAEIEKHRVPGTLALLGDALTSLYMMLALDSRMRTATHVVGYPARPVFQWTNVAQGRRFAECLTDSGLLYQGYLNLTLAHTARPVLEATRDALAQAFDAVATVEAA